MTIPSNRDDLEAMSMTDLISPVITTIENIGEPYLTVR
jgi:hypothetical protein